MAVARGLILEPRNTVDSAAVERILKVRSEVPIAVSNIATIHGIELHELFIYFPLIENSFSLKLAPLGFDFHSMLVSDKLHEWDIGEWKAFLEHLVRILYACPGGASLIDKFNARCGCIQPTPLHVNCTK